MLTKAVGCHGFLFMVGRGLTVLQAGSARFLLDKVNFIVISEPRQTFASEFPAYHTDGSEGEKRLPVILQGDVFLVVVL